MTHLDNSESRPYRSPLRVAQAQDTHDRILEGALRVLAGGLADLSIPAVAREAGVSVPTVYRIFRTKRDLLAAMYPYSIRRTRAGELKPPTSIAGLRDGIRVIFDRLESLDEVERAAIASRGAEEIRHLTMEARVATSRQAVEAIAPGLSEEDRERLTRLLIVLTMSATARMLREHLGLSADDAVDDVDWAIRAVIDGRSLESRE